MTIVQFPPHEPEIDFHALDSAFLGSLLPGIVHNWATPLSGVIGATQLLERRVTVIEDLLRGADDLSGSERDELRKHMERNRTNVEILSRNAEHLADLLQTLVFRITRGSGVSRDCFPLHDLMRNELRFLEANLQFKHKVRKNLALDPAVSASAFCYGFVAAAIEEFITFVIDQHDYRQRVLEMSFSTFVKNGQSEIMITSRLAAVDTIDPDSTRLDSSLQRLRDDGWTAELSCTGDRMTLELRRPARTMTA